MFGAHFQIVLGFSVTHTWLILNGQVGKGINETQNLCFLAELVVGRKRGHKIGKEEGGRKRENDKERRELKSGPEA